MKYIKPKSLTWWAGIFALVVGIASLAIPDNYQLSQLGQLVSMLSGGQDANPASLIAMGLGLIGIRGAISGGTDTQVAVAERKAEWESGDGHS